MRGQGATARHAREKEPEPPPEPDGSELRERISRFLGHAEDVFSRLDRIAGQQERIIARLDRVPEGCEGAQLAAAAAAKLADRDAAVLIMLTHATTVLAETRMACEADADMIRRHLEADALGDSRYEAGMTVGYERRVKEEQEEAARAPRSHRAPRNRHLRIAGGAAVKMGIAATAAATVATTTIVVRDSASVYPWVASPSPAAVKMHLGHPDEATEIPSPRAPSPSVRPSVSAAAKSATPAPVAPSPAASSPALAPSPSSPAPVSLDPVLDVQRLLDLGGVTRGTLPMSAEGSESVAWTASTVDGVTLSQYSGVLVPGQPLNLEVFAPQGYGKIYITVGTRVFRVVVTSSVGVPAGL